MSETTAHPLECAQVFCETLPVLMRSLHGIMLKRGEEVDRRNMGQVRMLEILHRGPRSLSELAAFHHVTPSTMSRSVDVLVRKGWVARESDPVDRRQVVLTITDEGRAARAEANQQTLDVLIELLGQHDDGERARLADGLSVLRKLVGQPHCEEQRQL
jgi:DNA-binding MarR family transcriptional regulator